MGPQCDGRFARLGGRTIGIVAQQPAVLAGVLDVDASQKAARFVRFCDCFHIPLVVLEDVPGFMPGLNQEHGGIIRHGAKLLYALLRSNGSQLTVIVRKAYAEPTASMTPATSAPTWFWPWPSAEIAVMGPEGAVNVIFRREIAAAEDPVAKRNDLVADYRSRFANPYIAAANGFIDDVIEPHESGRA